MKGPLVFFDGVCGLCNRLVDFLLREDKKKKFLFMPLQSPRSAEFLKVLGERPESELSTLLLVVDGKTYRKSDAILKIVSLLPLPWPLLKPFVLLPQFLRDKAYDLVAKRRYQFFGKRDTCRLPSAEEKARFFQ